MKMDILKIKFKAVWEYLKNNIEPEQVRKLSLLLVNTLLLILSLIMFFGGLSGSYYMNEYVPGKKEMLPLVITVALLLLSRHWLKARDSSQKKPDKLYRILSDKRWIAILLLFVLLLSYYAMYTQNWGVSRDAFLHYVYLRSLYFDGDLDFTNDYELFGGFTYFVNHETGYWMNPFSIGCSILSLPFFIVANKFALTLHLPSNGLAQFPYYIALGLAGLVFAWIGLVLLIKSLRKFFNDRISVIVGLFIWLGTSLTFYVIYQASMSHAFSFFASSLFLYLLIKVYEDPSIPGWILLGIAGGLMMLVRPQNIAFFLAPATILIGLILREHKKSEKRNLIRYYQWGALFIFFASITFTPQMMVWQIMYNSALTVPQGPDFMEWSNPKILQILFSTNHGLITWTPAILFAFIGFIFLLKKNKLFALGVIISALAMTYINSIPNDWWGGFSFGARRFSSTLPYFAFGIAAFIGSMSFKKWAKRTIGAIMLLMFAWNLSLLNLYTKAYFPHSGEIEPKKFFGETTVGALKGLIRLPGLLPRTLFLIFNDNSAWHFYEIRLKNEETTVKMSQNSPHLRNGWSEIRFDPGLNNNVRVSKRDISSIHFFSDCSNILIKVRVFPLNETKWIVPAINGFSCKSIGLSPGWQTVEIKLDPSRINDGLNIFRLDSHWQKPEDNFLINKSHPGEFIEVEWIKIVQED